VTPRRASLLLLSLLALAAVNRSARAAGTETPADLGPAATTGKDASDGIKSRAQRVQLAMACGNEFHFAQGFALASRNGNKGYAPNPDLAQWPVTLLVGKAAVLIDQSRNHAPCTSTLDGDISTDWGGLTKDGKAHPGESAGDVVNRVYLELYDSIGGITAPACASVAHTGDAGKVNLSLSLECLARQIRAVMEDPRHGSWTEEGGKVTPELPGTSADKLPCLSELKFKVKGVEGDWDMGVIEYTRLTSLLYRFGKSTLPIGADVAVSLIALNRRFLTLRSSPDQGATARETFNLVTSCGNLPNQFGDAIDTVNGTGADPQADNYSKETNDAVGKKSFWDSFWRFLAALLVLLAIALAAAIVGAIAGNVVGALAGSLAGYGVVAAVAATVIGVVVFITFVFGGIQETENHLLMQNTSRYLKDKLMMAELSSQDQRKAFDTISDLTEDVRIWLLDRLQRIAREDFVEYNAKPYNRLSHASILNIIDYACDVSWDYDSSRIILNSDKPCDDKDRAIVDAAAAVMDLDAAKDAVSSLEGRRFVPYRRLVEHNYQFYIGRSMLELGAGADNQLGALQIWTGQMRHAPGGVAAYGSFGELEWYATSTYRPDPLILDIAVNKTVAREQQYRHHTRERYVSGNGWLITAGGTDEGPAQGFSSPFGTFYPPITGDVKNDRGVGVPTTLMTGAQIAGANGKPEGRARVQQFLRFEGSKQDWGLLDQANTGVGLNTGKPLWSFSNNNCVAGSFACGLTLRLPSDFDAAACRTQNISRNFFVVDSTKCPSFNDADGRTDNDIFIAIYQSPRGWGFFEVAQQDAYGRSTATFADAIKSNNKDRLDGWNTQDSSETVKYFAVTQNKLLEFTPKDENFGADRRACGVVNHESGARFTISSVPAAQQGNCLSVGPRIFIDLNDAKNPIRRGEGGLTLERFGR
jgi:hypothetical protein